MPILFPTPALSGSGTTGSLQRSQLDSNLFLMDWNERGTPTRQAGSLRLEQPEGNATLIPSPLGPLGPAWGEV